LGARLRLRATSRCRRSARHDGRRDLALWVLEGNELARRFYERAGWRGDDGTKPFGDSGLYEVRYRKQV
jgi:hypothetical protein